MKQKLLTLKELDKMTLEEVKTLLAFEIIKSEIIVKITEKQID